MRGVSSTLSREGKIARKAEVDQAEGMNTCKFLSKFVPLVAVLFVLPDAAVSSTFTLTAQNTGYYWYQRQNWSGGSDTQSGFLYGDATGLLHTQRLYDYYGGSDRYWEQKSTYLQISLDGLNSATLESASLWIYVVTNDSPVATSLNHVTTQSTAASGDASQQIPGDVSAVSSSALNVGWNQVDITSFILADLEKSYSYSAFSIPAFDQSQDENRILSFYGASTTVEIDGSSAKPYVEVQVVPEPGTMSLLVFGGMALALAMRVFPRKRG